MAGKSRPAAVWIGSRWESWCVHCRASTAETGDVDALPPFFIQNICVSGAQRSYFKYYYIYTAHILPGSFNKLLISLYLSHKIMF